jgi:MraZ protein
MLLTGTYPRTLDEKKRLALPKRIRDELGTPGKLFVTPGQDQCLLVYSQDAYEQWARRLDEAPATDKEVLVFRRLFFGQTEAVEVDRTGRVLLPERLIAFADLKHDVVLLGVRDHLEIWDAERWRRYSDENAPRFDAVAENVLKK